MNPQKKISISKIQIRRSKERGHFNHGWLDTYHTFSFADYYDPEQMGFRSLRVINEDRVEAGQGFGTHGHRDMEIITYVLEGAVAHKDSMGHEETLRPGELQRMSAGTGVRHSEFNPLPKEPLHLYQIWIEPDQKGHKPEYEQKEFPLAPRQGKFGLLVSPDGREGSLRIHQDAFLYGALLKKNQSTAYELKKSRHAWIQVLRGSIEIRDEILSAGDGAAISDSGELLVSAKEDSELLLFDLN